MGFFNSYRIKKAITSLVIIASFLLPVVAKAEWSKDTRKSYVDFSAATTQLKGNHSPEAVERVKAASQQFVKNVLIEVQVSLKTGNLAAAIGDLELAKRGMESLKILGLDTAKYKASAKELEKQIKDKEAQGLATVKTITEPQREGASPACDKEPNWVKKWRNGEVVWKDGDKIYVVGYAKERGEATAREMATRNASTLFGESIESVKKYITQDIRGGSITLLITGEISNLSDDEFHHHLGEKVWESWVLSSAGITPSYE